MPVHRSQRPPVGLLLASLLLSLAGIVCVTPSSLLADPAVDGTWGVIATAGPEPGVNYYHAAVLDPVGNRMIVVGGAASTFTAGQVWVLDLGSTPTWSRWELSPNPGYRGTPGLTFDEVRNRVLLFGGGISGRVANDVWALDLNGSPTWSLVTVSGTPPPSRDFPLAFYDTQRDRMLVYGGNGWNDVWALDFTPTPTWSQISPTGPSPPAQVGQTGIYDPVRDQLIVYGGYAGGSYALSLTGEPQWSLFATGSGPTGRGHAAAVLDPIRHWLILFGGYQSGRLNETWALDLSDSPTWFMLNPEGQLPPGTNCLSAVMDLVSNRMITYGGIGSDMYVRALQWPPVNPAPVISALVPSAGTPGDTITIGGTSLHRTQQVQFGETPAEVISSNWVSVLTTVPDGASSGPVTVTTDHGVATSAESFTVGVPPEIIALSPSGGHVGDAVTILGRHFAHVQGVLFHDVPAAVLEVAPGWIKTVVPEGATTGRITVTTEYGSGTSPTEFTVGPHPEIVDVVPDSAKVGRTVLILGRYLAQTVRVSFGGGPSAPFVVDADTSLHVTVVDGSMTGLVEVATETGSCLSPDPFQVIPWDSRPQLRGVRDVPADQGGKVVVRWWPSDYDNASYTGPNAGSVVGYRVWRRAALEAQAGAQGAPAGVAVAVAVGGPAAGNLAGWEGWFWEAVGEVPAARLDGYAFTSATTQDSMAGSNPYTAFFVQALTRDQAVFYSSGVDSAYSVDNLSPAQPVLFLGSYGTHMVALHWGVNSEPDLYGYRLYRGAAPDFVPGPGNLVSAQSDTGYVDYGASTSSCYKLCAVDVHGNESRFALVTPSGAVGTLASLVSAQFADGVVRLRWTAGANPGLVATLYRRTVSSGWLPLGNVTADGSGWIDYEDRDVQPGAAYGYRLGIFDGDQEVFLGEAWVDVPLLNLALQGVRPNPVLSGELRVHFTLPNAAPTTLQLHDVTGRLLRSVEVGMLGGGYHVVALGEGSPLPAGVYLVRLVRNGCALTAKAVVVK